jgi:NADPH:quinone reductase-like Zn-dependent oxidoreductase
MPVPTPPGYRRGMKAIVQDRYGSPDNLRFEEVDKPAPADNEVLVRVQAAAVNAFDWHVMRGDPYLARTSIGFGGPKVKIRGRDFAGVVEAVGGSVSRLRPGDEVFGEADGSFAEYARARDTMVDTKPANLTFEQAAAVPLAANTALIGLRDKARVQPGQRILINGASGGVGLYAVQIAKAFGAEVTGVCSTRNLELVKAAGADQVIDYTRDDFTRDGQRYDVVFDLVGNHSLAGLRRALTPEGTLILSGGGVFTGGSFFGPMGLMIRGTAMSRFIRQRLVILQVAQSTENLAVLRELVEAGKLTPVIDRTYPLSEAAEAIRYLEGEHARAKVVITV